MIRKITIERREKLAGSGINFFVVMNFDRCEFEQNVGMKERLTLGAKSQFLRDSKQVFPLTNGEIITIDSLDMSNSFFVVAFTSAGRLFSEIIVVDEEDFDVRYAVTLKLGLFKNQFVIDKL